MDAEAWLAGFEARLDRSGGSESCWPWLRTIDAAGYGIVSVPSYLDLADLFHHKTRGLRAHRVAHRLWIGPIQEGMHVDHTCHSFSDCSSGTAGCLHRRCGNPAHLEAVPPAVNSQRASRNSGSPAYGFRRTPNGTEEIPEEQFYLKVMKEMRADGATLRDIATALNNSGVPGKRGGRWDPSAVSRCVDPGARDRARRGQAAKRRRSTLGHRSEWLDRKPV